MTIIHRQTVKFQIFIKKLPLIQLWNLFLKNKIVFYLLWQQASTLSGKRKEGVKMRDRNNYIGMLISITKQLKALKFSKILSRIQQIQGTEKHRLSGPDYHLRIRNTLTLNNLAIAPGYQGDKQFG